MYTAYTYQDWEKEPDKLAMLRQIIDGYKASADFQKALTAQRYFRGDDASIARKVVLRAHRFDVKDRETGKVTSRVGTEDVVGNRIGSSFFFRFVTQQNQFLLSGGVVLEDEYKDRLGKDFDKALEQLGEMALIKGVSWGFFDLDHLEVIDAARDSGSGFVALQDEWTGAHRLGVQFWQISADRPLCVRLFEEDGVTLYREDEHRALREYQPKRPYRQMIRRDVLGESVIGEDNWGMLPVFPLYPNGEHQSELTPSIKAKIDAYDNILSDFGDNLDRANDVYWALNNFGGTTAEVAAMLEEIHKLKAVVNYSDGVSGGSTAEPHTIEVPYAARQTALDVLERALYADYMALNMTELTGGSLTNVAIKAATANLNLKADRYEWQVFRFVRQLLLLQGIDTDEIRFTRQSISNDFETVQAIQLMREDIDVETALRLNPYIQEDEIAGIIERKDAESVSGLSGVEALEAEIAKAGDGL